MGLILFGAVWSWLMYREHARAQQRLALNRLGYLGLSSHIHGPYRR